jgi:hypothetical protein
MIAVLKGGLPAPTYFFECCKLFTFTDSFGGVENLWFVEGSGEEPGPLSPGLGGSYDGGPARAVGTEPGRAQPSDTGRREFHDLVRQ